MRYLNILGTALLFTAAFTSCASKNTKQNVVQVELSSNPTTGYSWECKVSSEGIAQLKDSRYTQNNAPKGMVGVGGTQTFVFECLSEGSTKITFTYRRPWEGGETGETKEGLLTVDKKLNGTFVFD